MVNCDMGKSLVCEDRTFLLLICPIFINKS
nr:MAG TPA: hypothetical protein [Bacteriophage sp.]